MEAFPFLSEVVSILVTFWSDTEERRMEDPGHETIVNLWDMLQEALKGQTQESALLDEFRKNPARHSDKTENMLKHLMYRDPDLVEPLQMALKEYYKNSTKGGAVYVTRGDVTLKGPNARVEQDTNIEVDNVDLSKYIKSQE